MSKITVVIPTLNNEKDIETCLKALKNQTFKDFEILFVDGYSKDKTVEIGKRYDTKIVYDNGYTRGHACNTALDHVNTPYVVFTDADCIPRPNWLEELMKEFDSHPEIAGIGGPNYSPPDDPDFAKCVDIVYSSRIMTGNARYGSIYKKAVEIDHNPGCNAAYKTEYIKRVRFDSEDDGILGAEDVVFDYKIRKNGEKLLFTPNAVVWHRRRTTLKKYWKQVYWYGFVRAIANKKYPELRCRYHIYPTSAIFILIALFCLSVTTSFIIKDLLPILGIIFLFVFYLLVCVYSSATSYSKFKNHKHIIKASLLIPVGHLAWGAGYFKGLCKTRKERNK